MIAITILDCRRCIKHFERCRSRYYKKKKNPDFNGWQITKSIDYFNSRIRHYKGLIRLLREDY